jgi:type IV pilus assembly protein PilE
MEHISSRFRHRGVTLKELMVVVVVIGILAAIANMAYRQYAIRLTRTDAKRELLLLAQRLERCFTRTDSYQLMDNSPTACLSLPLAVPGGTYVITGVINADDFLLTATPQAGQATDSECADFTINQLQQQGISGTGTAQVCWADHQN